MNVSYANQFSLTFSGDEVFLHFATIHPAYENNGNIKKDPEVDNEHIFVLTKQGFDALKSLLNSDMNPAKE